MNRPSPDPDTLARQLLLHLTRGEHQSPDELAGAAEQAYRQLRDHLSVFLGPDGFDALWARALQLAQREVHYWDKPAEASLGPPPGLQVAVGGLDLREARALLIAAFASFSALLYIFIGRELGFRLVQQAWPQVRLDAADPPGEEGEE